MLILGLDFETTGLDTEKDQVIEVGAILYSTGHKKAFESTGFFVKTSLPITPEVTAITGILPSAVEKFGYEQKDGLDAVVDLMNQAEAVVGQNVTRFDKRILGSWGARHGVTIPEKLWIDTRTDLPGVESKTLSYMAADHGFLNLFPHSALADVQTCLKIVSFYDIDVVVARAKEPVFILKAHVSYESNGLAKKRKYGWNPEHKLWYKIVKQSDVAVETSHNEFDVSFVEYLTPEQLWYS